MSEVSSGGRINGGLRRGIAGGVSAMALLLGLGACASSFTGERTEAIPASLTVRRVLGEPPEVAPLQPVPGDVWPTPEQEERRPTLGDPNLLESTPATPPPAHRPIPRGSSTGADLLQPGTVVRQPDIVRVEPPAMPRDLAPPPRRADGQIIPTPSGPVVTSGGGRGYSTYNRPGGGSGIAVPQGATTLLIEPDGTVQQVPTPR
ncbi:hypothetical protein E0493_08185 [Roseomonas sp. M0104]|uniref:Uncharacterized protein n=1 Tax=Teichococcus coralli TaxID=2545983 RepID=A0A845BIR5_9PROT|nr:hypothetical protein [Pseudoroseomonas coralli]MXP63329.1 hypothetical protein [Pseudoroseomonas coralli]